MRIPVAVSLESRDGTVTKDAKVVNGILETKGEGVILRKRSGFSQAELITAGTPQAFFYWNGTKAIIGDSLCRQTAPITSMNPYGKGSNIALSNGNLTVTGSSTGGGCLSVLPTDTAYFEVTINDNLGGQVIGVGNSGVSTSASPAGSNNAVSYYVGGTIFKNGASLSSVTAGVSGTVVGVFADFVNATVAFYVNNSLVYTASAGNAPATNSGSDVAWYAVLGTNGNGGAMTVNFGATTFTYSPPSASQTAFSSPTISGRPYYWADGGVISSANYLLVHNGFNIYWYKEAFSGGGTFKITGPTTLPSYPLAAGIEVLDGYAFVLLSDGTIRHSDLNAYSTWTSTNAISAQSEPGRGMAIKKAQNYLAAFKEWSLEYFYNAGNPSPGSVLSPVPNGLALIGCANGDSVSQVEGSIFWLSQVRGRGRSVHVMRGLQQQPVSTPDVERILNQDNLLSIYAYGMKLNGHVLYVLTLVNSNITLVYDATSSAWSQWTSLTAGTPVSVSSITRSGTTATVTTSGAHGLSDGDPVLIAGANQSGYNGTFQIQLVSSAVFTIPVSGSPVTPATGTITATPYTETYFKFPYYANCGGINTLMHESDGHRYIISSSLYQDAGNPVNLFFRTSRLDGGDSQTKVLSRLVVVGDKTSDTMMLRQSGDDCTTFTSYRQVDLSLERPMLRRLGKFRRRTIEGRHIGNTSPRIEAIELEIE